MIASRRHRPNRWPRPRPAWPPAPTRLAAGPDPPGRRPRPGSLGPAVSRRPANAVPNASTRRHGPNPRAAGTGPTPVRAPTSARAPAATVDRSRAARTPPLQQRPEPRRVVHHLQVADLVPDDVVEHLGGRQQQPPVEAHRARPRAAGPAGALPPDRQPGVGGAGQLAGPVQPRARSRRAPRAGTSARAPPRAPSPGGHTQLVAAAVHAGASGLGHEPQRSRRGRGPCRRGRARPIAPPPARPAAGGSMGSSSGSRRPRRAPARAAAARPPRPGPHRRSPAPGGRDRSGAPCTGPLRASAAAGSGRRSCHRPGYGPGLTHALVSPIPRAAGRARRGAAPRRRARHPRDPDRPPGRSGAGSPAADAATPQRGRAGPSQPSSARPSATIGARLWLTS